MQTGRWNWPLVLQRRAEAIEAKRSWAEKVTRRKRTVRDEVDDDRIWPEIEADTGDAGLDRAVMDWRRHGDDDNYL